MAKVTPARRAALEILRAVRSGELLDPAFARHVEQMSPRERAWTQELVYGVFRLRGRVDLLLAPHVRRGLPSLEPDILDTLRLGAYQLLFMDSVPAYAAISQAVEITKAVSGRGAGGMVNAVLQALQRSIHEKPPEPDESDLTGWGSHPEWLVRRWIRAFGLPATQDLVRLDNTRPDLYIRPLGLSPGEAREELREAGIEAELVEHAPDALRLPDASRVRDALSRVKAVVQDPAAGLVVRYGAFETGTVVDLAAAPGGKALEIAAAPGRRVVALDVSPGRMARVRENFARIGGDVHLVVADSRQPPLERADHVLLDAPCTGTGTFRRHPDGKWRVTPADLAALSLLQQELLRSAATLVRPGGLLVYSTCSLEPEENERQVRRFLADHPEFRMDPSDAVERGMLNEEGMLVITPQRWGFDGAFAARMRKAA